MWEGMTPEQKILEMKAMFGDMWKKGEVQDLLQAADMDIDTLKFITMVKDFYLQKDQKEIIARDYFVI
jgi:hypothetical protein